MDSVLQRILVVLTVLGLLTPCITAQSEAEDGPPPGLLASPTEPGERPRAPRPTEAIVVSSGHVAIELTDRGLNVEQHIRLVNLGPRPHVFNRANSLVRLPDRYRSLEAVIQQPAADQRVTEIAAKGFAVSGSLPPGTMVIAWRYQLPLRGSQMRFSTTLPWKIVSGMTLQVEEMPKARLQTDRGVRVWVTEVEKKPSDAPFRTITVRIAGIPGPSALRWFALTLSIIFIALGLIVAIRIKSYQHYQQCRDGK
jgi:hypothetical protein